MVQGLRFEPLLTEELVLVAPGELLRGRSVVSLAELREVDLLLPRSHNYLRKYVDEAFAAQQMTPRVVAEIESAATLSAAVASQVGATVLPASAARAVAASIHAHICRIESPAIEVPLALCTSDHLPSSEPAKAVRAVILELVDALDADANAEENRQDA